MEAHETKLRVLLEGQKQFVVPLFQRTYSWRRSQWEDLWNDIVENYSLGSDSRHFLGPIVTKSLPGAPDQVSPFLVIDGQQRLTTLTLLLAALRDVRQSADKTAAAKIHDLYLMNRYVSGHSAYKVLPTQADREAYFNVIDRVAALHGSSPILDAYQYFCSRIKDPDDDDIASLDLERLEAAVLSSMELVSITLGETDNEYRIFESLNAKGEPLTQADLLRNYFFMRIPLQEQESAYRTVWLPMQQALGEGLEAFFRYQYMSAGDFLLEGDIYQKWKVRLDKVTPQQLLKRS